jgi:hypothetical protein
MDVIGSVTAGAAGLAATLAGVNLYLSGRRELDKWIREALMEIFVLFLDASFKHASTCRTILFDVPPPHEADRLRSEILEAHDVATRALTRLRLLAPPSVVKAATTLLNAEYLLAEPCFSQPCSREEALELIKAVRRHRTKLLESTRSALGLRQAKGTGGFELNLSWRDLHRRLNEGMTEE